MSEDFRLCAILLAISPWILSWTSANSYCSSQDLDEQCGEHSYHIIKPMMQYFEQINLKTAESDKKILAYENERKKEIKTYTIKKIKRLEEKIDKLTEESEHKKEVIRLQKQVKDLDVKYENSLIQIIKMKKNIESLNNRISQQETQLGDYSTQISNCTMLISQQKAKIGEYSTRESNLTTILQGKEKEVSRIKKDFEQIEIANTELKKTVESLNSQISQQETQLGDYSTVISNFTMLISQQKAKIGEYSTRESNLTTILQGKEKEVSSLKKDFEQIEIANTELKKTVESLNSQISYQKSHVPNNCIDMNNYSGLLSIKLDSLGQFTASCDSLLAGSGWTVIQRRINGSVDFHRNWEEYKQGFGNVEGEFFIGLEKLHLLTKERRYELYFHLVDQENEVRHARYDNFRVENETSKYKLSSVGKYSGNAGESFSYHKGEMFSTFDCDNDDKSYNCAVILRGGWWFSACGNSNLNGKRFDCALKEKSNKLEQTGCIYWHHWHGRSYSLKNVQMMIRPWKSA